MDRLKITYRGYPLLVDYVEDRGAWVVISYILTEDVDMDKAIERIKREIDERWK